MRWAVVETGDGGARLCPLDRDGRAAGPVLREPSLAEAVRSRPEVERWVWRSTAEIYRRLAAAGVRVERCYDVEAAEALLIGHEEGQSGQPHSLAAAWARLHGRPVPQDAPVRTAQAQPSLFEPGPVPLPPGTDELTALLEVYAGHLARTRRAEHPDRMRLLLAAESAGMLVATEMGRAGVPWRADVHRKLLDELLGERYPGGGEPRRMAELADEVSRAFGAGRRVRPDLPQDIIKAFAGAGISLASTRKWELQQIDHPAVAPLLRYKTLYRLYTAHGWTWLQQWVHDGRFRPEYLPGGTVSGRWTTNGGGALQIPKVIRQAVRADPGWRLVVADAAQMEPRVLAAVSRDRGLMELAGRGEDLYADLAARAFGGDRDRAKLGLLGAIYGQTSGDALKHMADLRRRYPAAVAYVDEAARAGEEGRLVRTWLGRTCPPASVAPPDEAGLPQDEEPSPAYGSGSAAARARGRFTRNFVVQGSAADWALLLLAALRRSLSEGGLRAELVFFQHDEVIVHCPAAEAATVAGAITAAAATAGRIAFGETPVRFPFTTAVVECYAEAK
ncbi:MULTISPECIES: bifunctional 3'-5' exonuclease/DNA polymerase [unclassified Streptomyces]|uniref:bifunctional 3'-5' exonuclease/DNA polymerase n=1 Tax=unclassified Streptomyces TaxID=2593676 RepID=UPI000887298E|nr:MULTISPECIES: bifunctional 3'-5' exonuclease/DNA polymerase [unclassified Streptomyces]PBC84073.1 DNA polymerase-1 [Streptomyces sp. 2321.6]SDR35350.1 DNA polymerase-1 [Streptomyces sp. KS_16]SED18913.1 DNA polymerase-1 [Streptomyces sp. 2133.1]SEE62426.1 DNA polymerase-1 [Streptomyces sp. 2112.3]SNC70154.1 DNA polymerase-1 [Streptomyces sp. 2114.4]